MSRVSLPFVGVATLLMAGPLTAGPAAADTGSPSGHTSWPRVAFDLQHTGDNPSETALAPWNIAGLTQQWATNVGGTYIDGSPVLAADVQVGATTEDLLYEGDEHGNLVAIDAATGTVAWHRSLGWQMGGISNPDCSSSPFGVSDSPVIDRSANRLYVVDGTNQLWALDLTTGATAPGWPISVSADSIHEHVWSGLNELDGKIYVPMASECDAGSYRGRVVVVDASTARISSTFYVNGADGPIGGAIWGWAGVSFETSGNHIFLATGNDTGTDPNAGHADAVVALQTSNLALVAANEPGIAGNDNDFGSTPVLFQSAGCPAQLAVENKNGSLYLYDQDAVEQGPVQSLPVADPSYSSLIGDAAWSASSGLLFVADPAGTGSYQTGLLAFRLVPANGTCHLQLAWQTPSGAGANYYPAPPPVVANGVVYYGDGAGQTIHALEAASGQELWSQALPSKIEASPIVVNGRVYVPDWDGRVYSFGLPAGSGGTTDTGSGGTAGTGSGGTTDTGSGGTTSPGSGTTDPGSGTGTPMPVGSLGGIGVAGVAGFGLLVSQRRRTRRRHPRLP